MIQGSVKSRGNYASGHGGSDYEAVVVFLQPFVIDLNDNRAWVMGGVTAEQMNDRILVVAGMPNGTGLVHQTGIPGEV